MTLPASVWSCCRLCITVLAHDLDTITFYDSKGEFVGVRRAGSGKPIKVGCGWGTRVAAAQRQQQPVITLLHLTSGRMCFPENK